MLVWKNLPPGEVDGVAVGDDLDDFSIDRDAISANRLDVSIKDAKGRVVFEKVRSLLDTTSVIDGNDIKGWVFSTMPTPQEVPSNSSKSIDSHFQLCLSYYPPVLPSSNLHFIKSNYHKKHHAM